MFEIIKGIRGNEQLVTFSLLYLDGMLEENRSRIENLVAIQKSHNKDKHMDLIGILVDFFI